MTTGKMTMLDGIRSRVEAESKIEHYRTGPGRCVCGFDAYRVGYYVYDYGEERQRHEDNARRLGLRKVTDATRMLDAIDAALTLANEWSALAPENDWADGGMADTVLADAGRAFIVAITTALEGTK